MRAQFSSVGWRQSVPACSPRSGLVGVGGRRHADRGRERPGQVDLVGEPQLSRQPRPVHRFVCRRPRPSDLQPASLDTRLGPAPTYSVNDRCSRRLSGPARGRTAGKSVVAGERGPRAVWVSKTGRSSSPATSHRADRPTPQPVVLPGRTDPLLRGLDRPIRPHPGPALTTHLAETVRCRRLARRRWSPTSATTPGNEPRSAVWLPRRPLVRPVQRWRCGRTESDQP